MLSNYLKTALRHLLRHKWYTLIHVFGLSIGIAGCILGYMFIRHELSYDLVHLQKDRIFRVNQVVERSGGGTRILAETPFPMGPAILREYPDVKSAARMRAAAVMVKDGNGYFQEEALFTDPSFFSIFTHPLSRGDVESALVDPQNVVLSMEMADRYFQGKDPIGSSITFWVRGENRTGIVTGVAAPLAGPSSVNFDFLLPIQSYPNYARLSTDWRRSQPETYLLLNPQADTDQLITGINRLVSSHYAEVGGSSLPDIQLQPLMDIHLNPNISFSIHSPSEPLYSVMLAGIALFVLTMACINFMTLSIGRLSTRIKETSIRKTLGAQWMQVFGQFWGEAVLLTLIALGGGLILAELALPSFQSLTQMSGMGFMSIDSLTVGVLVGIVILTGMLAGSYPAVLLARFQTVSLLKSPGGLPVKSLFSNLLIAFQFILAAFLLISTFIMQDQLQYLANKDLGYNPEQVIVVEATLDSNLKGRQVFERYRQAVDNHPEVISMTASSGAFAMGADRERVTYRGVEKPVYSYRITPGYLETLQIPLVAGRDFSEDIATDMRRSVLVNEAFLREFGLNIDTAPGHLLVGVRAFDVENPIIVGVVKDHNNLSLRDPLMPVMLHTSETYGINQILIRIAPENSSEGLAVLEETWGAQFPNTPFVSTYLEEAVAQQYQIERIVEQIIRFSTMLAIVIIVLGLIGLTALSVARRTREIGVRKVLGASSTGVLSLLFKDFAILMGIGFTLAVPLAYVLMSLWLQEYAYRIDLGMVQALTAGVLIAFVTLLSVGTQVLKTARMNPVDTLRYE